MHDSCTSHQPHPKSHVSGLGRLTQPKLLFEPSASPPARPYQSISRCHGRAKRMLQAGSRMNRACVICHKRKIKCDFDSASRRPCSNCEREGYECVPRQRKRKRYTLSPSPPAHAKRLVSTPSADGVSQSAGDPAQDSASTRDDGLLTPGGTRPGLPASTTSGEIERPGIQTPLSSISELRGRPLSRNLSSTPLAHFPPHLRDLSASERRTSRVSYLGRSEYISNDVPIDDDREMPHKSLQTVSERDKEILQMQQVFDLPPRATRDRLFESFWACCYPWTPIVERSWVEGPPDQISPLLMQAILLAGSRVLPSALDHGSSEEFYKKAKMLFWMGVEKDPLITIAAVVLFQWWNPEGPEHVSIDTSGFWLRISVGLAYQVGLHREPAATKHDASIRRRLWWSLVARDSLVNAGHGRPRAITINLTDVRPPSLADFGLDHGLAELFSAHVEISRILGDLTQCFLEKHQFQQQKKALEDRLFRWIHTLPTELRLSGRQPKDLIHGGSFEARQLHVQYFVILIILNRSVPSPSSPSTASLLASSFVAGIFEEFIARDEIRYLGAIFTFYLLVAGVTQLSCYRYSGLRHLADHDIQIIFRSQEELAKRWPSALGALNNLSNVRDKVTRQPQTTYLPENNLTRDQAHFFSPFGPALCREWDVLYAQNIASFPAPDELPNATTTATSTAQQKQQQQQPSRDLVTAGILQDLQRTPTVASAKPALATPTTLPPPAQDAQQQQPSAPVPAPAPARALAPAPAYDPNMIMAAATDPTLAMAGGGNALVAHLLGPDLMGQYGVGMGDWVMGGDWEGGMML